MNEGNDAEPTTSGRRHHEVRRRAGLLWTERCGVYASVNPDERVEITGRWASGEQVHSSHLVRIAGVRSFGCVHARPWLGWHYRGKQQDWITCCCWDDCPAGGEG